MAQQLRVLVAIPEKLNLVPSTHMAARDLFVTPILGDPIKGTACT